MPNANGIIKRPTVLTIFTQAPLPYVVLDSSGIISPPVGSVDVPAGFFPLGLALQRVEVIMTWRKSENTNVAVNQIHSPTQYVQVQKGAGALTNAIRFLAQAIKTPASSDGPGDAVVGGIDVKATVDSDNATYNMQWTDVTTDVDDLILHDVKVGLRFYLR